MTSPPNGRLVRGSGAAKTVLRVVGMRGDTIEELAGSASAEIIRLRATIDATKIVLREHGANPNGKLLPGAVAEALMLTARGDL